MKRIVKSSVETVSNKSKLLTAPALMLALVYFIPACTDSGVPVGPGGGANQPPTLNPIGAQYVAVNNTLNVTISAADAESTPSLTIIGKPAAATFTDNNDGTAAFAWIPAPSDAGMVNVTFTASDDSLASVTQVVSIEVIAYTYSNYIGQLFRNSCDISGCHDMASMQSGFSAQTYSTVIGGGNSGQGIAPGDTAGSIIYQRLLGIGGSQMPITGTKFTAIPGRMDSIATWILARAPEN